MNYCPLYTVQKNAKFQWHKCKITDKKTVYKWEFKKNGKMEASKCPSSFLRPDN